MDENKVTIDKRNGVLNTYFLYKNFLYIIRHDKKDRLFFNKTRCSKTFSTLRLFFLNELTKLSLMHKEGQLKYSALRVLYWLTKPYFLSRRVWLIKDRKYTAGDNGEHLHRFIVNEKSFCKEVSSFYSLDKSKKKTKLLPAGPWIHFWYFC